jgi:hypothetical protein
MSMKRDEWLREFGECTTIENTPINLDKLLTECSRPHIVHFVWSEFDRVCEEEDCFAGTRWTEIMTGVHLRTEELDADGKVVHVQES